MRRSQLSLFRRWASPLLVLSALVSTACGGADDSGAVRIGIVLPLSGSMAEYGENARRGLTLAQEELNRDGSGRQVELIVQDTLGTPSGTIDAVRRLIDVEHVKFIIGGLTSGGVLSAAPYAQENGVLFFSPAASAPSIPDIGNLVFRNWQSDSLLAETYATRAFNDLGLRSVAILNVSNDYGTTNATVFADRFQALGGRVVLKRAFPPNTVDFRTLATQVRDLAPVDGVFVAAYPDEYRSLIPLLGGLRGQPKILVSDTFFSPALVAELAKTAEGVYVAVASKPSDEYKPRQAFVEAYKTRFGASVLPGLVSDTAYDALNLVVRGIRETDGLPASVASWLLAQRGYQGAAGVTTFTPNGDLAGGTELYRVANGVFSLVR